MTIKELADVAGVSGNTITRCANELFPLHVKRGIRTVFTKEQAYDIMLSVRKKNLVAPLQDAKVPAQNGEVGQVMIQIMKMMSVLVDKVDRISSTQLQIEAPAHDYYSLVGYCSLKGIKTKVSELSGIGMQLRRMTIKEGYSLRKIPDERWGEVNSYPVEILEEYFTP